MEKFIATLKALFIIVLSATWIHVSYRYMNHPITSLVCGLIIISLVGILLFNGKI